MRCKELVTLGLAGALASACESELETGGGGSDTTPPLVSDSGPFFEEVTATSGIDFRHETGGFGLKRLPETMGGGACLFDADGDARLDLFLVNSRTWADDPAHSKNPVGRCALYLGEGDGRFRDASAEWEADVQVYGMGCAAADYDGDADLDLYITTLQDDLLLENRGGRFLDRAEEAGVAGRRWHDSSGRAHPEWTTACLWLDVDLDGWLDLFVGGYCQWSPEIEIHTTLDGDTKAFTTPDRYRGLPCRLYRNLGDGTFEELDFEGGRGEERSRSIAKALGAATWDLDADGLPEIFVANDTRPNFLFSNRGGGRFDEVGGVTGLAYDEQGRARAGMGIDVAELDGTGPTVVIGNFADEELTLRRYRAPGLFESETRASGLGGATVAPLSFGLGFHDLDLDGALDLVVTNGHIEPDIARFRPGQSHAQASQLFLGRFDPSTGLRTFLDGSAEAGADFARPRVGRALVAGDLDGDGDLDLVITQNGGPPAVLMNRSQERTPRHYLRVELRGPPPNTAGIGARIVLLAGGRARYRTVRTGSSYLGHGETIATFGLGNEEALESLEVHWPDGLRQRVPVEALDCTIRVAYP